jgi:hypothetical protein
MNMKTLNKKDIKREYRYIFEARYGVYGVLVSNAAEESIGVLTSIAYRWISGIKFGELGNIVAEIKRNHI